MDNLIKRFIWLYFFLLVGEGILRKWIAPGLSNPLLIIRDPVVITIYLLALSSGRFPFRPSVLILVAFALGSIAFATFSAIDPLVVIYGLRINYLHLPLIFIMADMFNRTEAIRIGNVVLWLTIPIGILMILQYLAGEHSWLNAGAGGAMDSQLRGALGRVRPPGPFTFITGPVLWFSLSSAFVIYGWLHRDTYSRRLLIAVTVMTVIIIPVSVSRMLFFSVLIVVLFGAVALFRHPGRAAALMIPGLLAAITYGLIDDGALTVSFDSRWQDSMATGFSDSVFGRIINEHTSWLDQISNVPLTGNGIGLGSNVGAQLVTGDVGFQLAESEWTKIIMELGPILGSAFILYRVGLAARLFFTGLLQLFSKANSLPWLICGACVIPVFSGQWGPPTILGFAVFGAGLTLAAARPEDDDEEEGEFDQDSTASDYEEDAEDQESKFTPIG